jgi:transcriptional regulator GlxA family with amidase domain
MNSKLQHIQNWEELATQSKWSVAELARLCGVSTETLRRHFLSHMGKTTRAWLVEQRMDEGNKLLSKGTQVKETAFRLGYNHQNNFSRQFKACLSICPSQMPINKNSTQNVRS